MPLDRLARIALRAQSHDPRAPVRDRYDLDVESLRDVQRAAGPQLSARTHHRLPCPVGQWTQQQNLTRRPGIACAEQTRAEHARGVEYERIARRDEFRKIRERAVRYRPRRAIHREQPACVPARERKLRDSICGELEVVIGRATPALAGAGLAHSTIVSGRSRVMWRCVARSVMSTSTR